MKRAKVSTLPLTKLTPAFVLMAANTASAAMHGLMTLMFDCYRPERHYMRGPGPKWHAARYQAEVRDTAGRQCVPESH